MTQPCRECGGAREYARARFEIAYPRGRLIASEVPALRCQACGNDEPAAHVRRQLDAVLEVVQEVEAVARKDFSSFPLRPGHGQ